MNALSSRFGAQSPAIQSAAPLTDDQLHRVAPSIFADEAHYSRSDRYAQIPTVAVLDGLREEGFEPFFACQTRVRKADKRDFTKHMLRLRRAADIGASDVNEIILLNSHDGTSSYQLMAGCFRFVCMNGMVLGDKAADIRVRHSGDMNDIVHNVIEGAYSVVEQFSEIDEHKDAMKAIALPAPVREAFAHAALDYRYGDVNREEGEQHFPVSERQLLSTRRREDQDDSLWNVYNRIQENMMKGGLSGRSESGRRQRTRPVTGIDSDVKLNRALWSIARHLEGALN